MAIARYRRRFADVLVHEGQRRVRRPLRQDFGLRLAVLRRQVEIERRVLRVRRPRRRGGELRASEEGQAGAVRRRLSARHGLLQVRARRARPAPRARQAAGAHDVQAAEDVRVLHADAGGAVASHRVADQAAARPIGDRPVVGVDVGDHVLRDELLEVSRGHRARVHRAVVDGLRVGQHDDHLVRALGERAFDGLRHVDLVGPLLGADRVAVQRVDDRVAARRVRRIARRQKDDDVAIDGVTLQVAFERDAVDLDVLHRDRPGSGNRRGAPPSAPARRRAPARTRRSAPPPPPTAASWSSSGSFLE